MLLAAILWQCGFRGALLTRSSARQSRSVFIGLTAAVLVIDLERPERFFYILIKIELAILDGLGRVVPHRRMAWSARRGSPPGWFGWQRLLLDCWSGRRSSSLVLATGYTGFLFAQGLGARSLAGAACRGGSDRAGGRRRMLRRC